MKSLITIILLLVADAIVVSAQIPNYSSLIQDENMVVDLQGSTSNYGILSLPTIGYFMGYGCNGHPTYFYPFWSDMESWHHFYLNYDATITLNIESIFEYHVVAIIDESYNVVGYTHDDNIIAVLSQGLYFIVIAGMFGDYAYWQCGEEYDQEWYESMYSGGGYEIEYRKEYITNTGVYESFNENGSFPSGWTRSSINNSYSWQVENDSSDDYSINTIFDSFGTEYDEWIASPTYDLSNYHNIRIFLFQDVSISNSVADIRVSQNGGLSWWTVQSITNDYTGSSLLDLSNWLDMCSYAKIAFRFHASPATGYTKWRIDDVVLDGDPIPPIADSPVPEQPPSPWNALSGSLGCTWHHPLGVIGTSLQLRIDANGDGDYLDGGAEDWQNIASVPDATDLSFTTFATWAVDGGPLRYEFRARSGDGAWGYSGSAGRSRLRANSCNCPSWTWSGCRRLGRKPYSRCIWPRRRSSRKWSRTCARGRTADKKRG